MSGTLAALLSAIFMAISIYLGSHFLVEPETSSLKRMTLEFYDSVYSKSQNHSEKGAVGFGYTGCKDIKVNTFDFLDKLNIPFIPHEKTHIVTIQDFVQTFASFFTAGASSEIFMQSKENFELLLSKMEGLPNVTTFGGNAPHMALRAAYENFSAVLVADIGQEEAQTIKALDVNSKIRFALVDEDRKSSDVHLIFEYPAAEYRGLKAPKGNKFYLNHDTISPQLRALDKYLNVVRELNVTKHALSGFHLIQELPKARIAELLNRTRTQWTSLRERGAQTIHAEMGAFQEQDVYRTMLENVLLEADSLGINEQEVLVLHAFVRDEKFRTLASPHSKPSLLLQKIFDIIEYLDKKKATLSRLHVHAKTMHHLCYRGNPN